MKILYTPWRLQYIQREKDHGGDCVFCRAAEQGPGRTSLVVHADPGAIVLLNRFPYNNGHLLVVPREHVDSLSGLSEECLHRCSLLLVRCEEVLRRAYRCQGINMGLNLGEASGAGISDHVHWHALPRWAGDTNFMTVLSDTRIVPEELEDTYDRLVPLFGELCGG